MTGQRAKENQQKIQLAADHLARQLDVPILGIMDGVSHLSARVKGLKKQLASGTVSGKNEVVDKTSLGGGGKKDAPSYFHVRDALRKTAASLNVPLDSLTTRVDSMIGDLASLKVQVEEMAKAPQLSADDLIADLKTIGTTPAIVTQLEGANPAVMRKLMDAVRKKLESVAVFLVVVQGEKVHLSAAVSRDLVDAGMSAGDWIKLVAPVVGGGGGGKPDMASGAGKQPENVEQALAKATEYVQSNG